MPRTYRNPRARLTAAALLVLLATLGLAACGGSSKGAATATNASATDGKRGGQLAARASALRECLKKSGITLPERKVGQGGPGARGPGPYGGQPPAGAPYGQPPSGAPSGRGPFGAGAGGGPQLPKGVTRAQFEAAIKKCGGGAFRRGGRGFDTAQARQRFARFAECMRKNGVDLPAPNASGKGPIFNTNSAAFKAAAAKCMKELRPSGRGAAPGAGAGAPPEGPSPGA